MDGVASSSRIDAPGTRCAQLSEFLASVSSARSDRAAFRIAIEGVSAVFGGAPVAILRDDVLVDSVRLPAALRVRALGSGLPIEVPGVGPCEVLVTPVPVRSAATLVVVRPGLPFSHEEIVLVRGMCRALGLTLGLISTLQDERVLRGSLLEQQDLLDRLGRIQRSIVHRAPLADVLEAICEGARALTGDEVAGLRLVDPDDRDHLVLVAEAGVPDEMRPAITRSRLTEGVGGRAVLDERLVVADEHRDAPYAHPQFMRTRLRAAMAAPVHEGRRVVGSLTVATFDGARRYSEAEQEALLAFAEHASLALNDARTVDALRATLRDALVQATLDPLTGLPNRSILFEHLEELLQLHRSEAPDVSDDDKVALLFIDLDRFKAVNDSLGHEVGDRVLVAVARRVRAAVRPSDLVARLAGDEFVVVSAGLQGQVDALGLADRIASEIAMPIPVVGRDVVVTASIGIAQVSPPTTTTADELLRDADMAMYRAKERGSDRIEVFGRNLRSEVRHRLELEHALRRAIVDQEFCLEYQPVVDVELGVPTLVEALVRWQHDGRIVPPDEFVPVAEETGLIVPIGGWVLRTACEQIATWRREGRGLDRLHVSVNVSSRQFVHEGFVPLVAEALDTTGLPPSALWLEMTESVLLDDVRQAMTTLRQLKGLGLRLSIDDFGTGYSSLAYLKRFPVDALKIDRSFVEHLGKDATETAVLDAIVTLGRALELGVVAEGIETAEQLAEVARLGVPAAQGFHFSPPLDGPTARTWLEARLAPPTLRPVRAS